jgi:sialate O-acetylesterase
MNLNLEVSLNGEWFFEIGDDMAYAKSNYNDKDWEKIKVPGAWENHGFPGYDGFAWYRITFEVPERLKEKVLYLKLGRIDDIDMVFLNGELIGSHGKFPPEYKTAYDVKRVYAISKNLIKFGKRNSLAIRVYDVGGQGGIVSNDLGIYSRKDVIKLAVYLSGNWKFSIGDDLKWAKANFNDSHWQKIVVPSTWENQGFKKHDGFAWYRKEIVISDLLRRSSLMLMLGKINDIDQVFFNGEEIGRTGNFSRKGDAKTNKGMYKKQRAYPIPAHLISPNKPNIIAVRVYDHGYRGGIYDGYIGIATEQEYLLYKKRCD